MNGGSEVTFGYDDDGLLTSAGGLTIHRRADNGLMDSTQVGSLTHSQDYNAFGELANLRYAYGGTAIFKQSLARDELGRIVEIAETAFGTSRTLGYRYDQAGRLYAVTVDGDTAARYFYHPNGNRAGWDNGELSPADTASGTSDEQDRLLRWRDTAYEYDDAGDLVQRTAPGPATTSYAYDALGNLNGVDLPGGDSVSYAVDGMNRRIGRKVNGRWSGGWVYRSALNVAAEMDSAGAVVNRYVYGADPQTPALMIRGGVTYRVIADHLGSVRGIVSTADGTVLQRRDYDAWGEVELESAAWVQALGFAGGLRDSATNLTRFGARDYDAETGRWTVKDPIGLNARRTNFYAYASNDPANLVDPSGLAEMSRLQDCLDWIQGAIDAIGTADPSGAADLANAAIYAGRGKFGDAGISLLGLVPYIGDAAKLSKVTAKAGATVFKTAHYASRLEKAGVSAARAELAVSREIANVSTALDPWRRRRRPSAHRRCSCRVSCTHAARRTGQHWHCVSCGEVTVRELNSSEIGLIRRLADKLEPEQREQLLSDLLIATVGFEAADGARVVFAIAGYERPEYRGQQPYRAEGRMRDGDGTEMTVLLHADENGRLLELEYIRWGSGPIVGPDWQSLEVV